MCLKLVGLDMVGLLGVVFDVLTELAREGRRGDCGAEKACEAGLMGSDFFNPPRELMLNKPNMLGLAVSLLPEFELDSFRFDALTSLADMPSTFEAFNPGHDFSCFVD